MGHKNSPLTPEGRKRLCERIGSGRPIAHVAAEMGVSRAVAAKWFQRWLVDGDDGLLDRSSRPHVSPGSTRQAVVDRILQLRRDTKWGPNRISAHLRNEGITISAATVHRVLGRHGIARLSDIDPVSGTVMRQVNRYEHAAPGDMVHVDVKKLGKIPVGGGWWVHGRDSVEGRASKRRGPGTGRVGYTYLHSAVDDHSRLAYTEALEDEKGETAAAFWLRSVEFFRAYGITRIERALTDNGSCYRSRLWAEALAVSATTHKRTRPYTPRTNGKVERFNGTLAREWAYVRAYSGESELRAALPGFIHYYNHHRGHAALGGEPPVSRAVAYEVCACVYNVPREHI